MTSSKDEIGELLIGLTPYDYEGVLSIEEVMTLHPELRKFKAALSTYIAREKTAAQLHQAFTDLEAMQNGDSDYEWVIENQRAEVERLDQRLKRIIAERGYKIGDK